LELADRLVALQDLAGRRLPPRLRGKLRVIHQSAPPLPRRRSSPARAFEVAVIGHLRKVKDPLRAAAAARLLPAASRLRVVHLGAADTRQWAAKARAEMRRNPRYVWRGEVSGAEVRRVLGRVKALVLSSRSEGGANVISEAAAALTLAAVGATPARDKPIEVTDLDTIVTAHPLPPGESSASVVASVRAGKGELQIVVASRIKLHIHDQDHVVFVARGSGTAR